MLRPTFQTVSSDNLAQVIAQVYSGLTPKGRLILKALHADYRHNRDEGLTRRQIAEQLGQYRLYPHDDRAIKRLEELGLIFITEMTMEDLMPDRWDSYARSRYRNITAYTRYHVHWLNGAYYDALTRLFKGERQLERHNEQDLRPLDTGKSIWARLRGIIGTK